MIVVAPNNGGAGEAEINGEEVRAHGGQLYVLRRWRGGVLAGSDNTPSVLEMPHVEEVIAPIAFTVGHSG